MYGRKKLVFMQSLVYYVVDLITFPLLTTSKACGHNITITIKYVELLHASIIRIVTRNICSVAVLSLVVTGAQPTGNISRLSYYYLISTL